MIMIRKWTGALRLGAAAAIVMTGLLVVPEAHAQQTFKSAESAADALVAAARASNRQQVIAVLGPGSAELASSGDPVQDEETRKEFVAAYDAKHSINREDGKPATLVIGQDDFPFPIPLVEKNGSWSFDTSAGREEILARRIGRNELAAIQIALAFYDAENEYADMMPKMDGLSVYAQRIVSQPGKKDGLYWPTAQGEPESPIGEAVADASQRGYRVGKGEPYYGYRFKVLTRQGPAAPGGELDYVIDGKMVGGFGLVAWPAEYGNSGIATFMINHRGDVYQKDLGPDTHKIASRISRFNPDHTWKKVVETQEVR
ncbi:MAG: DUF2950 domain-containing protein [Rhizobiales bacterium]|nr:DUF2950 domain-containing protein [Hyphomicrobiales bacterium]